MSSRVSSSPASLSVSRMAMFGVSPSTRNTTPRCTFDTGDDSSLSRTIGFASNLPPPLQPVRDRVARIQVSRIDVPAPPQRVLLAQPLLGRRAQAVRQEVTI